MRSLVAHEEGEAFVIDVDGVGGFEQDLFLEMEGTLHEPVVLDEGIGQTVFGFRIGFVFAIDAVDEGVVVGAVFPGQEGEFAGEAVGAAVLGDGGFTFGSGGSGAVLGVGSVGGDLGGAGLGVGGGGIFGFGLLFKLIFKLIEGGSYSLAFFLQTEEGFGKAGAEALGGGQEFGGEGEIFVVFFRFAQLVGQDGGEGFSGDGLGGLILLVGGFLGLALGGAAEASLGHGF